MILTPSELFSKQSRHSSTKGKPHTSGYSFLYDHC